MFKIRGFFLMTSPALIAILFSLQVQFLMTTRLFSLHVQFIKGGEKNEKNIGREAADIFKIRGFFLITSLALIKLLFRLQVQFLMTRRLFSLQVQFVSKAEV